VKGAQLYCKNSLKNAGNKHAVHPEKKLLHKAKSLTAIGYAIGRRNMGSLNTTWMIPPLQKDLTIV
jgi:hypothetical protein